MSAYWMGVALWDNLAVNCLILERIFKMNGGGNQTQRCTDLFFTPKLIWMLNAKSSLNINSVQ